MSKIILSIEPTYYIAKNAWTLHVFQAEFWLSPTCSLQRWPYQLWNVPCVIAGATPTRKRRVYKNMIQTVQNCFTNISQHLLLFNYSFDFYLPTSHLLGCNLPWLDLIEDLDLFLKPYNCEPMIGSSYSQTQSWSVVCVIVRKRPQST